MPTTKHSTCGDALWNTEVMNRRLQVVEVIVASFPIPEVFASKIKFLKVKWSTLNFKFLFNFDIQRETKIIHQRGFQNNEVWLKIFTKYVHFQ